MNIVEVNIFRQSDKQDASTRVTRSFKQQFLSIFGIKNELVVLRSYEKKNIFQIKKKTRRYWSFCVSLHGAEGIRWSACHVITREALDSLESSCGKWWKNIFLILIVMSSDLHIFFFKYTHEWLVKVYIVTVYTSCMVKWVIRYGIWIMVSQHCNIESIFHIFHQLTGHLCLGKGNQDFPILLTHVDT